MSNFYKMFVNGFINESPVLKALLLSLSLCITCLVYLYLDVIDVFVGVLFEKRILLTYM